MLDVLYAPWPTPLAQRVAAVGGTVAGGLDVLFWQATAQVELMTGHARSDRRDARAPWTPRSPHADPGVARRARRGRTAEWQNRRHVALADRR